jgi:PEP-CTERM motif
MLKRLCMGWICLFVASTAGAATIVTWQAEGTVVRRSNTLVFPEPGFPIAPPIGAPVSVTLTFDPASAFPTPVGILGPLPGCQTVNVSGSVSIGSYSAPIAIGSMGRTQSNLPGSSPCIVGTQTQFELFMPAAPADNPFKLPTGLFLLSYHDLLVHDAFPNSPTPAFLVDAAYYDTGGPDLRWVFDARTTLTAVEQPTAVPEPGTLTLLGLGLAAAYRRRRANVPGGER